MSIELAPPPIEKHTFHLEQLIQQYSDDVWKYAFFLTHNYSVSDDITQDTFLKAFEKLDSYRDQAHIKTWLLTITRNLVKDHWKKAWTRKVGYWGLEGIQEHINHSADSAESTIIKQLDHEELWAVITKLHSPLREVIILYGYYQLSYEEISTKLEVSIETVKSRIYRARQHIKIRFANSNYFLKP